jgi:hypothetical protein
MLQSRKVEGSIPDEVIGLFCYLYLGTHGSDSEQYSPPGCSNGGRRFGRTFVLLLLVYFLVYFSALKMVAICSSKSSGSLLTTRRHNP